MRIVSVVGARPQFVKLAAISRAAQENVDHIIVHTGQHYDTNMSGVFFDDLSIPQPDFNLAVGSGKHGQQTGAMLSQLEGVFESTNPDCVLVYGDTNSTIAAALAAVKLHIPVAHLEAGLRSFNRRMPEEHNRVATDHLSDLCLAPTQTAMGNLHREGLTTRSQMVGDVMTDILLETVSRSADESSPLPFELGAESYYVATVHRPANTDDPERLRLIVGGLAALSKPVLLVAHPRLLASATEFGITLETGAIKLSPPLPYPVLMKIVSRSSGVITDSGGLQKEAFLLRVNCTTLRSETEWIETVELGWNVLVDSRMSELSRVVERSTPPPTGAQPYGDGHAAMNSVRAIAELIERAD